MELMESKIQMIFDNQCCSDTFELRLPIITVYHIPKQNTRKLKFTFTIHITFYVIYGTLLFFDIKLIIHLFSKSFTLLLNVKIVKLSHENSDKREFYKAYKRNNFCTLLVITENRILDSCVINYNARNGSLRTRCRRYVKQILG